MCSLEKHCLMGFDSDAVYEADRLQREADAERARFSDPRGPLVKILAVEDITYEKPIITLQLSCGHESLPNPIYTFKVGADYRCFTCKKEFDARQLA